MQRLITYVERLLARYDCVVVPSFGAFLKETLDPQYVIEEHRVYPGRERYSFNVAIKERDNLLEKEYARSYGISLRRARIMVDNEVAELQNILFTTSSLSFGDIGSFQIGAEGKVLFSPKEENTSSLGKGTFYGLTSYLLPRTVENCMGLYEASSPEDVRRLNLQIHMSKEDQENNIKEKAKYFHFRIRKSTLAASAACLLVGGLLLFMPGTDSSQKGHYTAGFTKVEQSTSMLQMKVQEATTNEEATALEKGLQASSPSRCTFPSYYVIITCLPTEEKAEEYLQTLSDIPFKATLGYVPYGRRYAVYAFASENKEKAKEFVKVLRHTKGDFQNAWLLHIEPKE